MELTTFANPVVIFTYDDKTGKSQFVIDWESSSNYDLVLDENHEELWFAELPEQEQCAIEDSCSLAIAEFVYANPELHDRATVDWAYSLFNRVRPFAGLIPVLQHMNSDEKEAFWS